MPIVIKYCLLLYWNKNIILLLILLLWYTNVSKHVNMWTFTPSTQCILFLLNKKCWCVGGGGVEISLSLSHCSKPQQEVHQTPKPCQSSKSVFTHYLHYVYWWVLLDIHLQTVTKYMNFWSHFQTTKRLNIKSPYKRLSTNSN
jgi:hypothetical protein